MRSFVDDLLSDVEAREEKQKLELDKARADQLLVALEKLDNQSAEIDQAALQEIGLIESWKEGELERLEKKRAWICWNLEQYLLNTGEKTIRLAHGSIRSRTGRDRLEIADQEAFLAVGARYGLLRTYPERNEPDLYAVLGYIRRTGEIPPGVALIPAEPKFSYTLLKKGDHPHGNQQTEA